MERYGDWALQEGASVSGMFERHYCNSLGGRVGCTRLTLIAWLSSKLDGRSHFLLRCSPKPNKYLWCVSKSQGYSAGNSLAIFIRGGEPWLMRYCWRICFKVLEVPYLAAVLPSSFA